MAAKSKPPSPRKGKTRHLKQDAAAEIFRRLREVDPEPKSELEYVNSFTLLVAVVLSAQATDAGVNKATRDLFKKTNTPKKMVQLGEDKLRERTREALEALPGVGRKTANVVLNVAFGEPTMAVDTHIFRISNRTGLAPGKNPLEVEKGLLEIVPEEFGLHAHHWLILHGRYVCKARKPECERCVISDLCLYDAKSVAM